MSILKWLALVALMAGGLVALVGIVGLFLPRSHGASREQVVTAPPAAVWAAITDIEAFPSWRTDVTTARRLPDRQGQVAWVEEGRSGKLTFAVERADPPRLLVARLADPDLPFGGTWTYELAPAREGTRVKITEAGEIYNPVFRFMARFVFGYEATIASYLALLKAKFSQRESLITNH